MVNKEAAEPLKKDKVFTKKSGFSHLPVMMCLSLRSPGPWVDRSSERERSTENTGLTGFYQT